MNEKRSQEFHRERISYAKIEGAVSHEKDLENMYRSSHYDKKMYEEGQKWFDSGLSLEDAPDNLRKNLNFINGFKRGERLALINDGHNKGRR